MRVAYVVMTFKKGMDNEEIKSFIDDNLDDVSILHIIDNEAIISWELGEHDELEDIDEDLYYVLESESLGTYSRFIP